MDEKWSISLLVTTEYIRKFRTQRLPVFKVTCAGQELDGRLRNIVVAAICACRTIRANSMFAPTSWLVSIPYELG